MEEVEVELRSVKKDLVTAVLNGLIPPGALKWS